MNQKNNTVVRTRIAPSPTGYLHIGTARTALFNYLFARRHGGVFVLRIEDTDRERSRPEFEEDICKGLSWLSIRWDEGPDCGGPYGPYRQSERKEIYREYLSKLQAQGRIYECFCTLEELEREREAQIVSKQPPRYSGKCRNLSPVERKRLAEEGRTSTVRFRIGQESPIHVHDHIRGELRFDPKTLDDFIIAKNFDSVLYNFAVVVDDHLMHITHVIRGEEHISNIPKQVLLDRALGFEDPQFAHIPLILNTDRSKLSKRQNKVSLLEYQADGYVPEALVNFMVLLGWNPGGDNEFFALSELEKMLDFSAINASGSVFDIHKLDWFNAHYIRKKDIDELRKLCAPYLQRAGYPLLDDQKIQKIIDVERNRLKKLSDITHAIDYYFTQPVYDPSLLLWNTMTKEDICKSLSKSFEILSVIERELFIREQLEIVLKTKIKEGNYSNGYILWPLRVALTGLASSPSPFEVAWVLGKEETLKRIRYALTRCV